jgi:hypothetical protein
VKELYAEALTRRKARKGNEMKKAMRAVVVAGAVVAGLGAGGIAVRAMPQPEGMPDFSKMSKKEMGAMMEKASAPAAEHALLEVLVGESDTETRMSMMPGVPPLVMKGTGKGEWILSKRFVQVRHEAAPDEELKSEAMSVFGYDTRKKKFFWWGIDTLGTYSVFAEGDYDKETKTFTLLGENLEPGMGMVPFKTVIKVGDESKRTTEIWFKMAGAPGADKDGWFRIMEMISTKKQK